jgi:hypothetical protein
LNNASALRRCRAIEAGVSDRDPWRLVIRGGKVPARPIDREVDPHQLRAAASPDEITFDWVAQVDHALAPSLTGYLVRTVMPDAVPPLC